MAMLSGRLQTTRFGPNMESRDLRFYRRRWRRNCHDLLHLTMHATRLSNTHRAH